MRELIALCGDVPVGLVPGGEDAYINEEERLELEEMGTAAAILGKSLYTGALDLRRCVALVQK